jgi:hypothetical protein
MLSAFPTQAEVHSWILANAPEVISKDSLSKDNKGSIFLEYGMIEGFHADYSRSIDGKKFTFAIIKFRTPLDAWGAARQLNNESPLIENEKIYSSGSQCIMYRGQYLVIASTDTQDATSRDEMMAGLRFARDKIPDAPLPFYAIIFSHKGDGPFYFRTSRSDDLVPDEHFSGNAYFIDFPTRKKPYRVSYTVKSDLSSASRLYDRIPGAKKLIVIDSSELRRGFIKSDRDDFTIVAQQGRVLLVLYDQPNLDEARKISGTMIDMLLHDNDLKEKN